MSKDEKLDQIIEFLQFIRSYASVNLDKIPKEEPKYLPGQITPLLGPRVVFTKVTNMIKEAEELVVKYKRGH